MSEFFEQCEKRKLYCNNKITVYVKLKICFSSLYECYLQKEKKNKMSVYNAIFINILLHWKLTLFKEFCLLIF